MDPNQRTKKKKTQHKTCARPHKLFWNHRARESTVHPCDVMNGNRKNLRLTLKLDLVDFTWQHSKHTILGVQIGRSFHRPSARGDVARRTGHRSTRGSCCFGQLREEEKAPRDARNGETGPTDRFTPDRWVKARVSERLSPVSNAFSELRRGS